MNTIQELRLACAQDPYDSTRKLILADALEEAGTAGGAWPTCGYTTRNCKRSET